MPHAVYFYVPFNPNMMYNKHLINHSNRCYIETEMCMSTSVQGSNNGKVLRIPLWVAFKARNK